MKRKPSLVQALCSAVAMPQGDGVSEWVHLLPAGSVRTMDGRGPYTVKIPAGRCLGLAGGGCQASDR